MRFVTIASTLLGATLAAPAPQPDDGKALDRRWTHIDVTDISLRAMNGMPGKRATPSDGQTVTISDIEIHTNLDEFSKASVKLQWGSDTVWCSHRPKKPLECSDINHKPADDYKFHVETETLTMANTNLTIFVSHKQDVVSFPVHIKGCGIGLPNKKCDPDQPTYSQVFSPAPHPILPKRALIPRGSPVIVSDIEIHAKMNKLSKASIKLSWDNLVVWCSHQPGQPLECSDINHNHTDDFKFHVETNDAVKAGAHLTFFVSHKDEVKSIPVHILSCSGILTKSCELENNNYENFD